MATIEELLEALMIALNAGLEVTITIRKPAPDQPKAENRVTCPYCKWTRAYSRDDNARRGLKAHYKVCVKRKETPPQVPQWLIDQTNEGKEL